MRPSNIRRRYLPDSNNANLMLDDPPLMVSTRSRDDFAFDDIVFANAPKSQPIDGIAPTFLKREYDHASWLEAGKFCLQRYLSALRDSSRSLVSARKRFRFGGFLLLEKQPVL